jgi:ribosomal protein S12 methylthiotransferase
VTFPQLQILPDLPERADNPIIPKVGPKGAITYAFVTLGCPKNLVDSEKMLGTLALDGYALVSDPAGADFVIVNTCGFIESSRAESKAVIREMLDLKKSGKTKGDWDRLSSKKCPISTISLACLAVTRSTLLLIA